MLYDLPQKRSVNLLVQKLYIKWSSFVQKPHLEIFEITTDLKFRIIRIERVKIGLQVQGLSFASRHEVGRATDDPAHQGRREDLDVGEGVTLERQLVREDRVEWVRIPHSHDVADFVNAINQAPVDEVRFTLGASPYMVSRILKIILNSSSP